MSDPNQTDDDLPLRDSFGVDEGSDGPAETAGGCGCAEFPVIAAYVATGTATATIAATPARAIRVRWRRRAMPCTAAMSGAAVVVVSINASVNR